MINVTKTYLPAREKLVSYIDKIYHNGWLTNNGEILQELEIKLSSYLGVENLILVSNGTLALQVAYKVLGIKGEVITTPFSFVATTSSLVWENLTPVFVDIDKHSYNMDAEKIEAKITSKTTAILPVHVFGNACDVVAMERIAKKHNLLVVYDAAHAFGVRSKTSSLLHCGDASVLSFHATKIFHTIEGGAIVFKRKEDYEKAKLMINFGISGYDKVDMLGINCKMNEFQAAMGMCMLSEMDKIIDSRKIIWENYMANFRNHPSVTTQILNSDYCNNYSYFPVVFNDEETLLRIKNELNRLDIFPRRYFYPSLNRLGYLENYQACEISESLATRILCLPIFPDLNPEIQKSICNIIHYYTLQK